MVDRTSRSVVQQPFLRPSPEKEGKQLEGKDVGEYPSDNPHLDTANQQGDKDIGAELQHRQKCFFHVPKLKVGQGGAEIGEEALYFGERWAWPNEGAQPIVESINGGDSDWIGYPHRGNCRSPINVTNGRHYYGQDDLDSDSGGEGDKHADSQASGNRSRRTPQPKYPAQSRAQAK